MGKKTNKAARMIAKAAGGADLVDYLGSKIAKARTKDPNVRKHIEDKTSGKRALVSAVRVAATVAPGVAYLKAARAGKVLKVAGRRENPLDRQYRRQDEEMWKIRGMKTKPGGKLSPIKKGGRSK